jgi:hypothetical protein
MASFPIDNAPEALDMDTFWKVSDTFGHLAKSCRFVARIIPRTGFDENTYDIMSDLTYLCEATEFPGRGLQSVDLHYYGPSFKMPYQTEYQDINMTFLCRTESYEREVFDDWMEYINPTNTFDFEYRDNYSSEITLFQMSEFEDEYGSETPLATYAFSLYDAYPVLINPQPVTWADDNFQRLTVTFTYSKWRRKNKDDLDDTRYQLVAGARTTP